MVMTMQTSGAYKTSVFFPCSSIAPPPPHPMKLYVHLDDDSPLPPHTLKIDDAAPLTIANVIDQFSSAYAAKVPRNPAAHLPAILVVCNSRILQHGQGLLPAAASLQLKTGDALRVGQRGVSDAFHV